MFTRDQKPNVVVKWLTLLLRTREVQSLNHGPEADYPKVFRGFPQSLQTNAGIAP
jgi:hypothetical protein